MKGFAVFARHQLGAVLATALDFTTMVIWVEAGIGSPVSGTAVGAAVGAVGNFLLSRRWIFSANEGEVMGQITRYALVAAAGLGWNTLGQKVVLDATGLPYPLTRAMVAVAVGILWNYPLHRWFVFRERPAALEREIPVNK